MEAALDTPPGLVAAHPAAALLSPRKALPMVPTQDVVLFATQISAPFPSIDYLPAGVVGVVLMSFAAALVLSVRRRDAD